MKKAQTILEYSILLVIVIVAFITMQTYIKRGFQGRYKQAVDDLGDQYEVNAFSGQTHFALNTLSESRLFVVPAAVSGVNGSYTLREDGSTSREIKTTSTSMSPGTP